MKKPRSILWGKLERNYSEEDYPPPDNRDFDEDFLPFCFTHIRFQPSTLHHILLRRRD